MKLQSASKKEILRIAVGSFICLALMLAAFFALSFAKIVFFDYRVVLGGVAGTLVAIGNFALLCLTIQNAVGCDDKKQMKARFQLSYNIRLIAQAAWVVVAFLAPCFHVVAAALPLLFPTAVIYFLQMTGKLVVPSMRKNPAAEETQQEDRRDVFEA